MPRKARQLRVCHVCMRMHMMGMGGNMNMTMEHVREYANMRFSSFLVFSCIYDKARQWRRVNMEIVCK